MTRPISAVTAYLLAVDVEKAHRKRKHAAASVALAELVPMLAELAQREVDGARAKAARLLAELATSEAAAAEPSQSGGAS